MKKVYVVGAQIPTGGAYMAYHIGRILALEFGYDLVDVKVYQQGPPVFTYDIVPSQIALEQMIATITDQDILIANPSFSDLMLSLRCKGKKIMYIQDYCTFKNIDGGFDLYICVSNTVKQFMQSVHGLSTLVIPPFISLSLPENILNWHHREPGSVLVYSKFNKPPYQVYLSTLIANLNQTYPSLNFNQTLNSKQLPQSEFYQLISQHQYLLNISLGEGFGLIPLEAMALGTIVLGTNGVSGKDFMQSGYNCFTAEPFPQQRIIEQIGFALSHRTQHQQIVDNGRSTAQLYSHARFFKTWRHTLYQFLGE